MPIYVVGAGPGDPKLLTLRAVELLREADVVAYGDLVPEELVHTYAPQAEKIKIGHKKSEHDAVIERLVEKAAGGARVVVLKNGDPTLFGRGIQICKKAEARGVPCEVVPGVSAFTAAAALHKIELTDGKTLRHVALFSFPHFDEEILDNIAADTAVIFMMGERLDVVKRAVERSCKKGVEVFVCHAVSMGGSCQQVEIEKLDTFNGYKPVLIIVRRCKS
ncbi:SAM-dependent methyltransferase [Pyrobaculum aerophilum]|uniref:uroporphyrinogen-III C-methyltransferase n=1 Tax=Pyrobaculum aerophilum TaxID=13773 RepID=A0A371R497_9CREN|nr:uroporphyrinogen-III C-methyltransferase [Pyrobaculum aerophilum]RFA92619.1 hypothetical protein CGL51_14155 [Pyrobaculum aerophilum]RFA98628.1 hypothetical protein CGL52_06280 [Pyrobaculum aerophilum]